MDEVKLRRQETLVKHLQEGLNEVRVKRRDLQHLEEWYIQEIARATAVLSAPAEEE